MTRIEYVLKEIQALRVFYRKTADLRIQLQAKEGGVGGETSEDFATPTLQ